MPLLQDLYERRRTLQDLSTDERDLLNTATFDFLQYRPPTAKAAQPKPAPLRMPVQPHTSEDDTLELPMDLPDYWWSK